MERRSDFIPVSSKSDVVLSRDLNEEYITEEYITEEYIIEETLTPIFPKDAIIHELNNGEEEFSTEGIAARNKSCFDKRKSNLMISKSKASLEELEYIEFKLDLIEKNIIKSRFEILDL